MGTQMETCSQQAGLSVGETTASLDAQHARYIDSCKEAGYCIHLNKEAELLCTYKQGGLMVYSQIKATGLVNLERAVSVGELSSGSKCVKMEEAMVDIFYNVNTCTRSSRKALPPL